MNSSSYVKVHFLAEDGYRLNFQGGKYATGDGGDKIAHLCIPPEAASIQVCYSITGVDECDCKFCKRCDYEQAEYESSMKESQKEKETEDDSDSQKDVESEDDSDSQKEDDGEKEEEENSDDEYDRKLDEKVLAAVTAMCNHRNSELDSGPRETRTERIKKAIKEARERLGEDVDESSLLERTISCLIVQTMLYQLEMNKRWVEEDEEEDDADTRAKRAKI